MNEKVFIVDAFTDRTLSGNPAGVVILDEKQDDTRMLSIAMELNLSETAFILKEEKCFNLRWFTPNVEVELCGHATLASAHVLYEIGVVKEDKKIMFSTHSGDLRIRFQDNLIQMNFPTFDYSEVAFCDKYLNALQKMPENMYRTENNLMVVYKDENDVIDCAPIFEQIKKFDEQGVIITSLSSDPAIDFISRYFAPKIGIDEDPVTGSSHCSLAVYWQHQLQKDEMTAKQVSERGGILKLKVENERLIISGQAVTVLSGKLIV